MCTATGRSGLYTMVMKPRAQTCQFSFTQNPTRSLSKNADRPNFISYHIFCNLKQHTTPSPIMSHPQTPHPLTPSSTFVPAALTNLLSVFSTLVLKKATVFGRKLLLRFLRPGTEKSTKAAFARIKFASRQSIFDFIESKSILVCLTLLNTFVLFSKLVPEKL